jgi:hypothetical protein
LRPHLQVLDVQRCWTNISENWFSWELNLSCLFCSLLLSYYGSCIVAFLYFRSEVRLSLVLLQPQVGHMY